MIEQGSPVKIEERLVGSHARAFPTGQHKRGYAIHVVMIHATDLDCAFFAHSRLRKGK
jgi:hypothetical protein